ncbi:LysR family transcriptional regulator [Streptomyces zagrosensis]|uniref:DNA-binding transcriptional LysR family regulator n=1 Tax=Streptomyces zagrosensis TaxID=1042984 RepID=A0A7W9Q425_9ACTN|nr:LysR family transcriptional regulator [Streptomyces zagrosensis]MBB5933145.1 DNA-binding transcriptional LysR family regulator [Streptomyces zagrosensis]
MELELRHLRILVAIADAGSLTRAAAALLLSQPAVSTQLKRIETALGQPVFVREVTGVRPTRFGDEVIAHARNAVASADRIRESKRTAATEESAVRLGGSPGPVFSHLATRLSGLIDAPVASHQFPSAAWALDRLANDHLDLVAITDVFGYESKPQAGIVHAVIGVEPALVLLPIGHRLAGEKQVELVDLAEESWTMSPLERDGGDRAAFVAICVAAGFAPRIDHDIVDTGTAFDLVIQGAALALAQGGVRMREGMAAKRLTGDPIRVRHVLAWRDPGRLVGSQGTLIEAAKEGFAGRRLAADLE